MAFLLDTNLVSELRKMDRCDHHVVAWQRAASEQECFISAISMMEIRNGILSARAKNPEFAEALEEWYENQVKVTFSGRVLSIDLAVSECCSTLLNKRTRNLADALIAATAQVNDLTLATRKTADFSDCEIKLVNPWQPATH